MNQNEDALLEGLRALAAAETRAARPGLETALLVQLKRRRLTRRLAGFGALAATVAIAAALLHSPPPSGPSADFLAVPYAHPLEPNERAELVRVNVSMGALVAWGLPLAGDPNRRVDADVVLGEDGLARAVRLVPND